MAEPGAPSAAKIVAISGSLRPGSITRKALDLAVESARKIGGDVNIVDLREWRLPPCDDTASKTDAEANRFRQEVKAADGLLIATPVYHESMGGMLKNALDLLYPELLEKIAALIAVGGGRVGQGQALEHLRSVLRETGTWVLPRQVAVFSSDHALDEGGAFKDKEVVERLNALGQELVLRCRKMRPRRAG